MIEIIDGSFEFCGRLHRATAVHAEAAWSGRYQSKQMAETSPGAVSELFRIDRFLRRNVDAFARSRLDLQRHALSQGDHNELADQDLPRHLRYLECGWTVTGAGIQPP